MPTTKELLANAQRALSLASSSSEKAEKEAANARSAVRVVEQDVFEALASLPVEETTAEHEARVKREAEEKAAKEKEQREKEEAEHKEVPKTTFIPTIIPLSSAEIPNSGRGMYDWQGEHSMVPPGGWPLEDYYARDGLYWNQMETSKGVYSFSQMDTEIAKATTKGGRLRFRIMAWMPGGSNRYPSYIPTLAGGYPDWNSALWLESWANLWKALGERYGSNPRIGWVDVGGYGAWGEWHMNGIVAEHSHLETANGVKMVEAVVKAFPKAHVVLGTSAAVKDEHPIQPPLVPAIVKAFPGIGFHYDNFGATPPGDGNNFPYFKTLDLEAWEEWAHGGPVIGEWWNQPLATLNEAQKSVTEFHTSMIGSGNNPAQSWKSNPVLYSEIIKKSGFRYQLNKLEITPLISGSTSAFTSIWENVNVAPTYDPWEVCYELRSAEAVVWSVKSSLDLRRLLPTGPVTVEDIIKVEAPKGTYMLSLRVMDGNHILAPLKLAINGRLADGSYPLGSVMVS